MTSTDSTFSRRHDHNDHESDGAGTRRFELLKALTRQIQASQVYAPNHLHNKNVDRRFHPHDKPCDRNPFCANRSLVSATRSPANFKNNPGIASSTKLHGMKSSGFSKSPSAQFAKIEPMKTIATIFSAPFGKNSSDHRKLWIPISHS
jgi:hypothetical protein